MFETLLKIFSILFTLSLFMFWPKIYIDKNKYLRKLTTTQFEVLMGFYIGIIGIVLAYVSLDYLNGEYYNARILLVIFSGIIGGPITILISGFGMNIGRLLLFPSDELVNILILNSFVIVALYAYFAHKYRVNFKNVRFYLYFFLFEIAFIILVYFKFEPAAIKTVVISSLFTLITFWAIYWVLYQSYLATSHAREMMALKQVDYLTQLPNNYAIEVHLQSLLQLNSNFSLMFIDINRFKQINNEYGYLIGDSILQELANILKEFSNKKDGFVGRIGGEEFCFILKDAPPAIAIHEGEALRKIIENHQFANQHELHLKISISIGISSTPYNGFTSEQLFVYADKALLASKKTSDKKVYHYNQYLKDLEFSRL